MVSESWRKEEYDMHEQLDLLNKWIIPKIQPKTTEETTVDSDHDTFRLFSESDFAPYKENYRFMHIGLVQVAFKPLTLTGLPESFIAALRDGRNQNWKKISYRDSSN
ncbi:hypothetical protein H5410_036086 [Solanum commersonii]|uniref:Uncharacterized protein n=1 Tax=Solanum commersonii TaxID=4109 RepID=A0A9J5Y740_SOLCO|nr:hypothetical protein H5410_036086 [Solanum commersonii]